MADNSISFFSTFLFWVRKIVIIRRRHVFLAYIVQTIDAICAVKTSITQLRGERKYQRKTHKHVSGVVITKWREKKPPVYRTELTRATRIIILWMGFRLRWKEVNYTYHSKYVTCRVLHSRYTRPQRKLPTIIPKAPSSWSLLLLIEECFNIDSPGGIYWRQRERERTNAIKFQNKRKWHGWFVFDNRGITIFTMTTKHFTECIITSHDLFYTYTSHPSAPMMGHTSNEQEHYSRYHLLFLSRLKRVLSFRTDFIHTI